MPGPINPKSRVKKKLIEARRLIKLGRYDEARDILETTNHATARQWINRIDDILLEHDDPFDDDPFPEKITQETRPVDTAKAQGMPQVDFSRLDRPTGVTQSRHEMALQGDYTTKAIVVLVLYFVLYIPGLVANLMWYSEAKRMEKIAGESLPGVGALRVLRFIGITPFICFIGFIAYVFILTLTGNTFAGVIVMR